MIHITTYIHIYIYIYILVSNSIETEPDIIQDCDGPYPAIQHYCTTIFIGHAANLEAFINYVSISIYRILYSLIVII